MSIVGPPKRTVDIRQEDETVVTQHVRRASETRALRIVQYIFVAGILAAGCVLAFQTRHLDKEFGESKQLIFRMYTIATITVILFVMQQSENFDPGGKALMQAIGVLWESVFCTASFLFPRLMQVRCDNVQNQMATNNAMSTPPARTVGGHSSGVSTGNDA